MFKIPDTTGNIVESSPSKMTFVCVCVLGGRKDPLQSVIFLIFCIYKEMFEDSMHTSESQLH